MPDAWDVLSEQRVAIPRLDHLATEAEVPPYSIDLNQQRAAWDHPGFGQSPRMSGLGQRGHGSAPPPAFSQGLKPTVPVPRGGTHLGTGLEGAAPERNVTRS